MADGVSFGKFVIPTGYESQEAKIALKRKLADALLQMGMQPHQGMRSPFEALGQMAQAFAGKRLEDKAAGMEDSLGQTIRSDYMGRSQAFNQDVKSGMDPADIMAKWGPDPFMQDQTKPFEEALGERYKGREGLFDAGQAAGFQRKGDYINKSLPNDPNASVWLDANNQATVNPVKAAASMYSNPNMADPSAMPTSAPIPVPGSGQAPGQTPPAAAVTPSVSAGGGSNVDVSLLNPQERQILMDEIKRRGGVPSSNQLPLGNPLHPAPDQKPPAGVVNGKPYWLVGGIPYDNPEGR